MNRPMFRLDPRLELCASFVREGCRLADIGTDHAYLPVWLLKKEKISYAIAADIHLGPLRRAEKNIRKYHVEEKVSIRLSDGLETVFPIEVDDIVIAGMGGETIAKIIAEAPWLKDEKKHLILQPMTSAEDLRRYLKENGFSVQEERAACDSGHCYTAMLAWYDPKNLPQGKLYEYAGLLDGSTPAGREYLLKCAERLQKKADGLEQAGNQDKSKEYGTLAKALRELAETEGGLTEP